MTVASARVLIGLALAVALPVTALASAPASRAAGCGVAAKLVNLYTFHIEARPAKKSYPRGEVVKIFVTVTRPAEEDPAGNRTPMPRPTSEPAADVTVGAALWVKNSYSWDPGVLTDDEGKATLHIRMPKGSDTGMARGEFAAEKVHYTNSGCPDIREVGYRSYDKFVEITR